MQKKVSISGENGKDNKTIKEMRLRNEKPERKTHRGSDDHSECNHDNFANPFLHRETKEQINDVTGK